MKLTLKIWRQDNANKKGRFETHKVVASEHMSFLEMLDVLNESLIGEKKTPVAFEHDCREGICGTCNLVINGRAHGPQQGTTVCQLHMRAFKDGDIIVIEPWRAAAFPVIKDLVVDRTSFDRIIQA
ncbi:MAG: succinate dehydrogenase / fumarate reductase iron-sulfur subunit, partial [Saprospiraceae bacterium]